MGRLIKIGDWIKANPPSWVTKALARKMATNQRTKIRERLRRMEHHAESVLMLVPKGTVLDAYDKGLVVRARTKYLGNVRCLIFTAYQDEGDISEDE